MKAKGFTLIELLFCMALIGIVLSFGGWVYQVFQGFQFRYLVQVEKTYELIQIQDRLQKDFSQAEILESKNPDCFRFFDRNKQEKVQYCLTEGFLIRSHQTSLDTFKINGAWNIGKKSLSIQDMDSKLHFSFHLPPRSQSRNLTLKAYQP